MCWSSQQLICTDHNRGYKCNYHTIAALIDSSFLTCTISKKHTYNRLLCFSNSLEGYGIQTSCFFVIFIILFRELHWL